MKRHLNKKYLDEYLFQNLFKSQSTHLLRHSTKIHNSGLPGNISAGFTRPLRPSVNFIKILCAAQKKTDNLTVFWAKIDAYSSKLKQK